MSLLKSKKIKVTKELTLTINYVFLYSLYNLNKNVLVIHTVICTLHIFITGTKSIMLNTSLYQKYIKDENWHYCHFIKNFITL